MMNIHKTHHIYNIVLWRKCFWIFFLENSPVQPLAKCPILHAISAIFANARVHIHMGQVCKNVLILSWRAWFQQQVVHGGATKRVADTAYQIASKLLPDYCVWLWNYIHIICYETCQLFPCIRERCTCGVGAWFFYYGVLYATGSTDEARDTMVWWKQVGTRSSYVGISSIILGHLLFV